MKKKAVLRVIIAVVAIVVFFVLSMFLEYTRTTSSDKNVIVQIPKGASEKKIAQVLKDHGVIDYQITFRLKMKNSPHRGKLNYGKYTLKKDMCLDDIIESLSKPSELAKGIKMTIPEGFSAEMIARRCEALGICTADEFLNELQNGKFNYGFIKDIPERDGVKYRAIFFQALIISVHRQMLRE